jgi:hypothetical protein
MRFNELVNKQLPQRCTLAFTAPTSSHAFVVRKLQRKQQLRGGVASRSQPKSKHYRITRPLIFSRCRAGVDFPGAKRPRLPCMCAATQKSMFYYNYVDVHKKYVELHKK